MFFHLILGLHFFHSQRYTKVTDAPLSHSGIEIRLISCINAAPISDVERKRGKSSIAKEIPLDFDLLTYQIVQT